MSMRREFAALLIAFLPVSFAAAQHSAPPADPTAPAQANDVTPNPDGSSGPYKIGDRISAPVVLHFVEAMYTDEARRAHYQGVCMIGLIVDAQGNPQDVHVMRSIGMGLDEKAVESIGQYKFKPAMKDGTTPVPVQITVEVDFKLYGRKSPAPRYNPNPAPDFDTVPSNVNPPTMLHYVVPKYSRNGRKNRITGECVIGLTVDTDGKPQNVHVVTSLEPSLDQNAVEAVKQWRYTPAMINGSAVPFESTVKVKFTFPQ
jgi:TonB family protein